MIWSLGGRSLVNGVVRCHPLEAVQWQGGQLTRRVLAQPFEGEWIDRRDARGIQRQVDRVADRTMEYVESHVTGLSRVQCSLTAGMDSRAVFAALCGAKDARSIDTTTLGGERSLDVVVARLPRVDPSREWSAGGNGGEIYRGFFYQYFGMTGVAPRRHPGSPSVC